MNKQHTPGPWETDGFHVTTKNAWHLRIADIYGISPTQEPLDGPRNHDEREANARLISSAPELLAACQKIVAISNSGGDLSEIFECRCDEDDSPNKFVCLGHEIVIAIAKAYGEA